MIGNDWGSQRTAQWTIPEDSATYMKPIASMAATTMYSLQISLDFTPQVLMFAVTFHTPLFPVLARGTAQAQDTSIDTNPQLTPTAVH